jgi:hypothetical protein
MATGPVSNEKNVTGDARTVLRVQTGVPVKGADRWNSGAQLISNKNLQSLEFLLDEAFRVPGTRIRFGLDAVIGLVPGLGDVVAALLSLLIPLAAWIRGVPYVTLIRMLANVSIGLLVGTIPVFGDIFDVLWKANHRNFALLRHAVESPTRHTWRDWTYLALLGAGIALIFTLPLLLGLWLIVKLLAWHPVH